MFCTILVESLIWHVYVFIFNFINFFIEIEFHTIHVLEELKRKWQRRNWYLGYLMSLWHHWTVLICMLSTGPSPYHRSVTPLLCSFISTVRSLLYKYSLHNRRWPDSGVRALAMLINNINTWSWVVHIFMLTNPLLGMVWNPLNPNPRIIILL